MSDPNPAPAHAPADRTPPEPPRTGWRRGLDRLSAVSIAIAAGALLGLVVVQGWQVFARYVINDSPSWTEPATILLLSTAMSFGAASGVHTGRHFGFFLLAEAMRPMIRRVVDVVVQAVIVAIGATLAGWGAVLFADGLDIRMAGAPLPQSAVYLPLALGGALMVVFAIARGVDTWGGGGDSGEAHRPPSSGGSGQERDSGGGGALTPPSALRTVPPSPALRERDVGARPLAAGGLF